MKNIIFSIGLIFIFTGPALYSADTTYLQGNRGKDGNVYFLIKDMLRYGLGKGVAIDFPKALNYAKQLPDDMPDLQDRIVEILKKNHGMCDTSFIGKLINLARRLELNEKEIPLGLEISFILYLKAAEAGDANAQCAVASRYERGLGIGADSGLTYYWYDKAAQQAHKEAMHGLACCFDQAIGVKKNIKAARQWYDKAAKKGNHHSWYALGFIFEQGDGVAEDQQKALNYYRLAAEGKLLDALLKLSDIYSVGGLGVVKDDKEAFKWLKIAADAGDAGSQNNVGNAYALGKGTAQDHEKAFQYYERSAQQGNANAQYNLGRCYRNGLGVTQSISKMLEWYTKAAAQNLPKAMVALADCHLFRLNWTELGPDYEKLHKETENLCSQALPLIGDGEDEAHERTQAQEGLKKLKELKELKEKGIARVIVFLLDAAQPSDQ